jgi:hypothetical protein
VLEAGMKIGLAVLIIAFFIYVLGWLPVRVPMEELPRLWAMPASDYLRATGMPGGWGWIAFLGRGDVLPLLGIALLSAVPLVSVLALAPLYAARQDWIYCMIVVVQSGVIALAASGVLASFH